MGADAENRSGVPRPDPFGQPRPPAAPRVSGMSYRHPAEALHLDPHHPPRRWRVGPHGRPPLEAVIVPRRAHLTQAVIESAWFILCYLVIVGLAYWGGGLPAATSLRMLVAFIVLTLVWRWWASAPNFPPPVLAGSDWLGAAGRGKPLWLPLYELTRVEATGARDAEGESVPGAVALTLWAGPELGLCLDLALLQANPALWDLVYRGIRHSIAAGAAVTEEARQALRQS